MCCSSTCVDTKSALAKEAPMDFSYTLAPPQQGSGIDLEDAFRMERMMRFVSTTVPNTLTKLLLGRTRLPLAYEQLSSHWQFAHGALLVFPESVDSVVEFLLR